jgi:hypothetical protein
VVLSRQFPTETTYSGTKKAITPSLRLVWKAARITATSITAKKSQGTAMRVACISRAYAASAQGHVAFATEGQGLQVGGRGGPRPAHEGPTLNDAVRRSPPHANRRGTTGTALPSTSREVFRNAGTVAQEIAA